MKMDKISYAVPTTLEYAKECLKIEDRWIRIRDTFSADKKQLLITGKFYARPDLPLSEKWQKKYNEYLTVVMHTMHDGPHQKHWQPMIESQEYGWWPANCYGTPDATDNRLFFHPKCKSNIDK